MPQPSVWTLSWLPKFQLHRAAHLAQQHDRPSSSSSRIDFHCRTQVYIRHQKAREAQATLSSTSILISQCDSRMLPRYLKLDTASMVSSQMCIGCRSSSPHVAPATSNSRKLIVNPHSDSTSTNRSAALTMLYLESPTTATSSVNCNSVTNTCDGLLVLSPTSLPPHLHNTSVPNSWNCLLQSSITRLKWR